MGAGLMAKRMSSGDGTRPKYDEKTKLWCIKLTISDDGENKSRKSLYGKSEAEVKEKRDKVQDELKNGCLVTSQIDKLTLGVWLNEWLEVYKKGDVRNASYDLYENCIRLWASDNLKKTPIKKIRHNTLQKFINELAEKYSGQTCNIMRTVLQQSLEIAVKNKYIITNPADGLKVPPKGKKEVVPFTKDELKLLLADRKGTRHYLYYVLSAYSGARIGEVLGLSWNDIDLKKNIIHIRYSLNLNRSERKYELGPTKTGKCREIPILPEVVNVLKWHKAKQAGEKLKIGKGYNINGMVFCNDVGDYLKIATVRDEFRKIVALLAIGKSSTPHTLRHTFVSQMISAGIANIKLISNMVGHANINITLDTYGHLMPNDTQEAFKALSNHMKNIVL